MPSAAVIVLVGLLDIAVHLLVTVAIGLWLNRMARREVEAASQTVMAGLLANLPAFLTALNGGQSNTATTNGAHRETVPS